MAKKIVASLMLLAGMGLALAAEDTGPKIGFEFVQRMDNSAVDGASAYVTGADADAVYSRTEVKATAAFDLGSGSSLKLSLKDRLEVRLNPGDLEETATDASTEFLGKIRDRNRVYANLDLALALDKAFNINLGLEGRLANDLRTDKEGTALPEFVFTPALTLSGAIDIFSYSYIFDVPVTTDATTGEQDNSSDDMKITLENTLSLGLSVKLDDSTKLGFSVSDYLGVFYPAASATVQDPTMSNSLSASASLSLGGLTPSLGFTMYSAMNTDGDVTDNVPALKIGLGFKKDNWSLDGSYSYGVNTAEGRNEAVETNASVQLKIKL